MLLLLLSLFTSSSMAVQNWDASLTAIVHTSAGQVVIGGAAEIGALELPTPRHLHSVLIPSVVVPVSDLSASIFGVMGVLKRPSFFDAANFPEITVTDVNIYSNAVVQGTVNIKGHSKVVYGTWKTLPLGHIEIDFTILLSNYNIGHRVMFFNIDDLAKVHVEMENPFEASFQ